MSWLVEQRQILQGYREGRQEAWEAIYQHYEADLRRFVTIGFSFSSQGRRFRFQGFSNPLDVDDVVQEVFVRAFSEAARLNYDGLHSFRNYLLAIARNVILKEFKRPMRTVTVTVAELDAIPGEAEVTLGQDAASPEQRLIDHELLELAQEFGQSLSHFDQRFFQLRFRQQLSQEETARRMRLTRAKIRTCERRVRRKLQRFMTKHGIIDHLHAARPVQLDRVGEVGALLGVL